MDNGNFEYDIYYIAKYITRNDGIYNRLGWAMRLYILETGIIYNAIMK
jgi:hypothetical protein